jgi:short-subunit dehydrogenase
MRERGYGRVVMVGSMLASFPLSFRGSYLASKAALRGFADAARGELSPYGVEVCTVEPGAIHTGIGERRTHYLRDGSLYTQRYRTMIEHLDANERAGTAPARVADTVLAAIAAEHPKPLYAVGSRAPLAFALRRLLPATAIERMTARRHGL